MYLYISNNSLLVLSHTIEFNTIKTVSILSFVGRYVVIYLLLLG